MTSDLQQAIAALPEELRASVERSWAQFDETGQASDIVANSEICSTLPLVWASSDYVARQCIRYPQVLIDLIKSGDLFNKYSDEFYQQAL
ncbi:MAG: hypothetical protein OEZ33_07775, partial [Gammaproteobacteria bacterium]|nr:hypothetical protein [Gammaproteobacteria bacterium]